MIGSFRGDFVAAGTALSQLGRRCLTRAYRRLRTLFRLAIQPPTPAGTAFDAGFDGGSDRSSLWTVKHDLAAAMHGEAAKDALKLWLADMDLPCCDAIRSAIEARARRDTFGYTFQPPEMWQAVVRWLSEEHAWSVQPESLVFAPSCVTSFATATRAFTAPGDRVLVMTPLYGPVQHAVTGLGRELVRFPLREGADSGSGGGTGGAAAGTRELQMDLESRLGLLLPTVRLVLLCSPHNPSGRVWRTPELVALAAACARHGVPVVEDAIWADWCLWGEPFVPFAVAAAEAEASGFGVCRSVTLGARNLRTLAS